MFSSPRRHIVPLFVYLSLLLSAASLVASHDLHQRDHANLNMKRLMKKRSPFPQDSTPPGAIGAAPLPTLATDTTSASASESSSSSSLSSSSSSSTASLDSSSSTATTVTATTATSSSSSSTTSDSSSSASTFSSSPTTTTPPPNTETLNLTGSSTPVSTVIGGVVTRTESVAPSDTVIPEPQSNTAAGTKTKSTTLTVIIAIAASVGGIAILWTIFRKWKLSSSKKFDRRLKPIDWQPNTGEDDVIPSHRRVPSNSSFHSGSGHASSARGVGAAGAGAGYAGSSDHGHGAPDRSNPFDDFDSPAHSAPIGGYADLSRGASTNPPMQEHLARGPSFNQGYDSAVPIHHQSGYGAHEAYPGAGVRY